ncbi:signal peptide protein [Cryptosporidium sp. chipmunk genotype I]|uniref:signal peptide protein n=1 Tax=Cryptosporidium sp. chipmunk genotype I TaxID=1280935 RepID=UPI00351A0953|nr:signal peptide protein [Cryptosporidium sp. chipmunk genotype I]
MRLINNFFVTILIVLIANSSFFTNNEVYSSKNEFSFLQIRAPRLSKLRKCLCCCSSSTSEEVDLQELEENASGGQIVTVSYSVSTGDLTVVENSDNLDGGEDSECCSSSRSSSCSSSSYRRKKVDLSKSSFSCSNGRYTETTDFQPQVGEFRGFTQTVTTRPPTQPDSPRSKPSCRNLRESSPSTTITSS